MKTDTDNTNSATGADSLNRIVRNYEYEFVEGEWIFNRDGEQLKSTSVSIIYDKDEPYDVLLKHGETDRVQSVFLSDAYSKMYKMGCDLRFVEIPPIAVEMLNKCLSISASKWCSKLEDFISANAKVSDAARHGVTLSKDERGGVREH